jgi:hypothetical protein
MNNPPDIKLIIAVHRECALPEAESYIPVQVGAAYSSLTLPYLRDDSGENISRLNPLFSELTGLYWAWKNLDYDWLGLVHYRRFFASRRRGKTPADSILKKEELLPLLERYRVLVPRKRHYVIETVYSHYDHTCDGSQLDQARRIIREKCPDYTEDFDALMRRRVTWLFNMMIMPRDLIDAYCTWLFDILFELVRRVDASQMNAFEKRYAGRVAESLFNVWIFHQLRTSALRKQDILELPYVYIGKMNRWKKATAFLKAKLFHIKYKASF